jgi:signal transduction histidine kinase
MRPVDVQVAPDLAAVAGEPTYLEQVLRNLLSNADKYSPAGLPIDVRVRQANNEIIVSVIDHGPGIEAEERDRIFDRFYRSSNAKTVSGAGIGLTVCKRLVDAQSGRIWASAADEGGLEVSFALPRFREDSE